MLTVIDRAAYDRIADDLSVAACTKANPDDTEHDHSVCRDVPGALLAEYMWRVTSSLAAGNGKAARIAVRRLDQAMGNNEIR
jgi:hypothetical protein